MNLFVIMKALIWKLRFAWSIHRRSDMPLRIAWDFAGANLENLSGDTSYSPLDAVQDEFDAWAESI